MSESVYVEYNQSTRAPIRIFKSRKAAVGALHAEATKLILKMDRAEAVGSIRHQTFVRSGGYCELCGSVVLESSGHMHEQKSRGKGGEISLDNSVFICVACHKRAHSNREPKFTRRQG